ncbi:MAG TPA: GNAT family protein [Chitinophagaceae bacterium]|nr:GNAT family protein [Chitinophagaceae bacterium]
MNWIEHPVRLEGSVVELLPLDKSHFTPLEQLAKDARIWEYYSVDPSKSCTFLEVFDGAFKERDKKTQYPFVIRHKDSGRIIGSTRFTEIQAQHRRLEIGWTWLSPEYWATGINLECKLLLLTYCFEELGTYRVQLRTDVLNLRSRKAIEKIGAQYEGVFRNDMVRENGTKRDSVYYSIIDAEWEQVKAQLTRLCQEKIR